MDVFECAICLQQFKDPRVISCGHTFCKTCLQQLNPKQLRCPLCQTSFISVDSLASNFVVLKWMEENKNQTVKKNEIKCDNCEEKLAVVWCDNCSSGLCEECDSTVHSIRALRNHPRSTIKEKMKKPNFSKCNTHFRDNELYCVDCQTLKCIICITDDHQQHKVQSAFKFADEKRVELKSCVAPFQNLEPLVKIEQEFRLVKEKDIVELEIVEKRAQVLKNKIIKHDLNIQQITNRTEKVKTSQIVLINSILEMGIMELLDNKNVDIMKKKIQDVLQEVYPEVDKERPEKERLEKESKKYGIGQSKCDYSGYRSLSSQEVSDRQNELLTLHEKNGGFICLDNFSTKNVFLTKTHWISVSGDSYIQCGMQYPNFNVSKGSFVKLFSYSNKKEFKHIFPLSFTQASGGSEKTDGIPSFYVSL